MPTTAPATARFEIGPRVGGGELSEVYRSIDRTTGRTVALKLLRAKAPEDQLARFRREVSVLADLRHPGIVGYVDHGGWPDGRPYLAMEWVEGEDLAARSRRKPLGLRDAVEIVRRASAAMAAVHARGVVHRDLKLSNVVLVNRRKADVRIIDFGVVKLPVPDEFPTAKGSIVGTPQFMAPEQARGEKVDPRADVYSLGSLLFRLATGRHIFEGEHVIAVLGRLVLEDPPRASSVRFDTPPALDEVIAKAVARDPAERYADGGVLARALARVGALNNDAPGQSSSSSAIRVVEQDEDKRRARRSSIPPAMHGTIRPPAQAERRIVAVVLAELPAPGLDGPTEARLRALLGPDVRVERLGGNQAVACVGMERTHGDEAVRAARAAVAITTSLDGARVAVATGRAVKGKRGLAGEALELAARQLERTAAGGVRIDTATTPLLEGRFVFRDDRHGAVLLHQDESALGARLLLGRPTPTVGRDKEIALLEGVYDELCEERSPRAALVTGPPGIGKSRLRYELLRRLAQRPSPPDVLVCRGDPMILRSNVSTLGRALRGIVGVQDGQSPQVQRDRVLAYVARKLRDGQRDGVAEFVGEIAGVPFPPEDNEPLRTARESPQLMQAQMRCAMEAIVRSEARRTPQLLVIEDLHWVDETTLDLADWLLGCESLPVAVFAFARTEAVQRTPPLWDRRAVTRLELAPLSGAAADRLVAASLPEADAETRKAIVERAGGNALFLEELVRSTSEGRDDLPLTVQALTQARLDTLAPEARQVVRAASVFGKTFWTAGVAHLLGREVDGDLERLVGEEIVTAQDGSRIAGQREWKFRHGVVRDVAYGSLVDKDRTALHRAAGRWLESVGDDDIGARARHADEGGDPDRAAELYARATTQAYANGQLEVALSLSDRGLANAHAPGVRGPLLLQRAQILSWMGRYDDQLDAAEQACGLAAIGSDLWGEAHRMVGEALRSRGRSGDGTVRVAWAVSRPEARGMSDGTWARLLSEHARLLVDQGRAAEARPVAESALAYAERAGTTATSAHLRALDAVYIARAHLGDVSAAARAARQVAERADQAGDAVLSIKARINLGFALNCVGRFEEGVEVLRRAHADAKPMRLKPAEGFAMQNLGMSLGRLGQYDEAIETERAAGRIGEEIRHGRLLAGSRVYEARLLAWRDGQGDLAAALAAAQAGVEQSAGQPVMRVEALAATAQVHAARGDWHAALEAARQAIGRIDAGCTSEELEDQARLASVQALFGLGNERRGNDELKVAFARLMARCAGLTAPDDRAAYLGRIVENRTLVDLARTRLGLVPPPPA